MRVNYLKFLIPFILLGTGLYLFPVQLFNTDFSRIPGDLGDARFNNYILEHGYLYFTGKTDNYWDAPFMYPEKNMIAYSDNLLGTLPIYSAFRMAGIDRETSFQFWILGLFALNFVCCFWALYKWTKDVILASAGAYIFAFSIFILGQMSNIQVLPRFMLPFLVYWWWKYLNEKKIKFFLFTCMGTVFQMYCGMYLGFLSFFLILCMLIAHAVVYDESEFIRYFRNLKTFLLHIGIFLISMLMLAPLILPYLESYNNVDYYKFENLSHSIPTFTSYFFSDNASLTWHFLSQHAFSDFEYWWFHTLFTGIAPWLGLLLFPIIALRSDTRPETRKMLWFWLLSLSICFLFTLNIQGNSLYYIIYQIPGFGSMRSINRIINTEIILFVLVFIFVLQNLKIRFPKLKYVYLVLPLIVVLDNLIIPDNTHFFLKKDSQNRVAEMQELIANQITDKNVPIAYLPVEMPEREFEVNIDIMLACQNLGLKSVNGYSGSTPVQLNDFLYNGTTEGLNNWCKSKDIDTSRVKLVYENTSLVIK